MLKIACPLFVTLIVLILDCSSSFTTPTCNAPQVCVYNMQNDGVCHQSCDALDGGGCPSGQVCTEESACCGNTPANRCSSPAVGVCCPPSGC
jgi:hypothetical protein